MTDAESPPYVRFHAACADLESARDVDKALKTALRTAREVFDAREACIARAVPGRPLVEPAIGMPQGALWNRDLLTRFLGDRRPKMPRATLIAPIRRHGRPWAVMALRRRRAYGLDDVRDIVRAAELVGRAIDRMDRERTVDVRARIDRKVFEQLRPNDLFYQILHGLRSLTRYDHSAAVLIQEEDAGPLRVVAEQVNWRKGKSQHVGITRPLDEDSRRRLASGEILGFDRRGGRWQEWEGRDADAMAEALDYGGGGEREVSCMLCAPLTTRDGLIGVLKVANCHPRTLGPWEADVVQRFLPQAAVAIRNLQRTTSLESSVLAAERKHVLAGLARGVSHDVNNAVGSMIPLVQQMLAEARVGGVDPETLVEDLEQLEASLQVCRRIFGGMLSIARGTAQSSGAANVRRAVDTTLAVLEESLRRNRVRVTIQVPEPLPLVAVGQGDVEQLLLNLATNARDAMPGGGELELRVRCDGGELLLDVRDTGCGIAPEHIARVREPFFTTKSNGSGLGLSICRSILVPAGGRMSIESQVGEGTVVSVRLPLDVAPEEARQ